MHHIELPNTALKLLTGVVNYHQDKNPKEQCLSQTYTKVAWTIYKTAEQTLYKTLKMQFLCHLHLPLTDVQLIEM